VRYGALLLVVLLGVVCAWIMRALWRGYYGAQNESRIDEQELEALRAVLVRAGAGRLHERSLFRSMNYWSEFEREGQLVTVEVCDGERIDYTRVTMEFDDPLGQGIQLLCEEGAGALGWLMSVREVALEDESLGMRFITMAQDPERLHDLLASDVGVRLGELRELVEDLQLTDQGLHVYLGYAARADVLEHLLDEVFEVYDRLRGWCVGRGPIASLHASQYQDALAEMELMSSRISADAASEESADEALPAELAAFEES